MPDEKSRTRVVTPDQCTEAERIAFCALVTNGNEVEDLEIPWLLNHGRKLAFVWEGEVLAGVGGLKAPDSVYHRRCFRKAGVQDLWANYSVELGWINSVQKFRTGMARRIVDPLLAEPEGRAAVYATVRSNNLKMIYTLRNREFETVGHSYASEQRPGEQILLLLRDAV